MKKIPLYTYNNKVIDYALVDIEDYQKVISHSSRWHIDVFKYSKYARCITGGKSGKRMHSVIMDTPSGMVVDHINGNGLDNRKINLRICSIRQNTTSKRNTNNRSSGYKGVFKHHDKRKRKYQAHISSFLLKKRIILGAFYTAEEAAACYNAAAEKLHGEFAVLNKI